MPWIGAKYQFASTFSYRLPNFSSSYALSAPIPSPSTIKLALVSAVITRTGNIDKGKNLFENIKNINVAVELPDKIAAYKTFLKRLKQKRGCKEFESTFGIREYIIYDGHLGIFLEAPIEVKEDVAMGFEYISYLGTSDSLCKCIRLQFSEPAWNRCAQPYNSAQNKEGIIFLLTDFTKEVTFENVNPYMNIKMEKDKHIITIPYLFPISILNKESNYVIYKTRA